MGTIKEHRPVILIVALISRYEDALEWSRSEIEKQWGPIELASNVFDFVETGFYEASMGNNLKKQFVAFEALMDPSNLPSVKIATNDLELAYAQQHSHVEDRPLNLDPGYLTLAKLVLATTKDRDHRLYLSQGIYAEVTLHFQAKKWQKRPWTYPDYQREDFQEFFTQCRDLLRSKYKSGH